MSTKNSVQLTKGGVPIFPITDVSLITGIEERTGMRLIPVDSLPTASADTAGFIYMVKSTGDLSVTEAAGGSYTWVSAGNVASLNLDGYATEEEVSQLGQDVTELQDCFEEKTIPASANLLNFAEVETGCFYWNGAKSESPDYNASGFIPVTEGQVITYQYGTESAAGRAVSAMRFVNAFDAQKQSINSAGATNAASYTVPSGVSYIRISVVARFFTAELYPCVLANEPNVVDYIAYRPESTILILKAENSNDEHITNIADSEITEVVGEIVNVTEEYTNVSCVTSPGYYKAIKQYVTKGSNSVIDFVLTNVVGDYTTIRASWGNTYVNLTKLSATEYRGRANLSGYTKDTLITLTVYVATPSATGSCDISINERAGAEQGTLRSEVRQQINVLATDTQVEIFDKLLYANDIGNCDVFFEFGTYTFDETLYDYLYDTLGYRIGFELPIGGGCRYYFNGATLTGEYNGDNLTVHQNCNVIGCRNTNGNFELYDGVIIANDIIYCVHDDVGASPTTSVHIHKHCNMHYIYNGGTFAADVAICKCIGGGTGYNQTIIIEKCLLEKTTENANKDCVTYHGRSSAPAIQTRAKIFITNTYMNGGCGAYHLDASRSLETIQFIVSNCVTTNINHSDVDYYREWNNVQPS